MSRTATRLLPIIATFPLVAGHLSAGTLGPFTYTDTGASITIDSCGVVDSAFRTVPATIDGKPVTTIGPGAFAGNALDYVEFPDSITSIGDGAFAGSGLESVDLPQFLGDLGTGVFENCAKLREASIWISSTEIPDRTFKNCTSLSTVHFGNNITRLGKESFYNSAAHVRILDPEDDEEFFEFDLEDMPDLSEIDASAFGSCRNLDYIKFPPKLKTLGDGAFKDCPRLMSAVFTGDAPKLGADVFAGAYDPSFKVFTGTHGTGFTYPSWLGYRAVKKGAEIYVIDRKSNVLQSGESTVHFGPCTAVQNRQSVTIFNVGNRPLTEFTFSIRGGDAKDFTLRNRTPRFDLKLAPSQSVVLGFVFTPHKIGRHSTTLEIRSNDANESPFKVRLTGKGLSSH